MRNLLKLKICIRQKGRITIYLRLFKHQIIFSFKPFKICGQNLLQAMIDSVNTITHCQWADQPTDFVMANT